MFKQNKINIILIGIILILCGVGFGMRKHIKSLKLEKERLTENVKNYKFNIEELELKNGELRYTVNSLTVKKDELEFYNEDLKKDVENMKIKIKNLQTVTKIEYVYKYQTDTLYVEKKGLQDFTVFTKDEWIDTKFNVHTSEPVDSIKVYDFEANVKDSLTTAYEVKYKGRWFWKRAVGVKVHLKSNNPYMNLDRIESYQIK